MDGFSASNHNGSLGESTFKVKMRMKVRLSFRGAFYRFPTYSALLRPRTTRPTRLNKNSRKPLKAPFPKDLASFMLSFQWITSSQRPTIASTAHAVRKPM